MRTSFISITDLIRMIDEDSIELYFLLRKKKSIEDIEYKVFKAEITSPEIRKEIQSSYLAFSLIEREKRPEIKNYVSTNPEMKTGPFYFLDIDEFPLVNDIIEKLDQTGIPILENSKLSQIWAYVIVGKSDNSTLYFFKKYSQQKALSSNRISMAIFGPKARFQKIADNEIFSIDRKFDVLIKVENPTDALIFSRHYFEQIFSFNEFYQKRVNDNIQVLEHMELFDNIDQLITLCGSDLNKIKKLDSILHKDERNKQTIDDVKKIVKKYNLKDIIIKNDRIEVASSGIYSLLRILNDDYARSEITNHRYEIHGKRKI